MYMFTQQIKQNNDVSSSMF